MERCFRDTYGTGVQASEQRRPADTRISLWELYPVGAAQVYLGVGSGEPGATRSPAHLCEVSAPGPGEAGTDPNLAWPCLYPNHRTLPWGQAKPRRCTLRSFENEIVLGAHRIKTGSMTNIRLT